MQRKPVVLCLTGLLLAGCNAHTPDHLTVTVKDLTPPTITTKNGTLMEGDSYDASNYYTVDDNASQSTVTLSGDNVDPNTPGKYNVIVTATDAAGNSANGSFTITVNEKPKPTPTPTPVPTPEPTPEQMVPDNTQTSNGNQSQQSDYSGSSDDYEVEEPDNGGSSSSGETQYFLFSDGYDFNTGLQACEAWGGTSYDCVPFTDADGVYIGYKGSRR